MKDLETRAHETWLGMVQPTEGLVVSIPVLVEAQCLQRQPPETQHQLIALCPHHTFHDLPAFLGDLLELTPDLWDAAPGYRPDLAWAGVLSAELSHYAPEGHQTIVPTLALRKLGDAHPASAADYASQAHDSPASRAGQSYLVLLWAVPDALALDAPETQTGPWEYPTAAKFERLLRDCRVPIGLLTNSRTIRLCYAPHGASSGHIDFRIGDMASTGGRPILDAFVMLLHARRFFSVAEPQSLPALLAESRKYQANVTNELGEQFLQALTLLLRGFDTAAERDGAARLDAALAAQHDHLYNGLLTVLLRLVFVLYAEDRSLLPIDDPLYEQHWSLFALFAQLQSDAGTHPDSMSRRFGAWPRILSLFRALFLGARSGTLQMPARRGQLFDPNSFAFLEGWDPDGSAPIADPEAQAELKLPTLDDDTVFQVLQMLIIADGQRLSYRALDVEQIGSVYEGLIGYHVQRLPAPAVCTRPDRVWLTADELLAIAPAQRTKWLQERTNLTKAQAEKLTTAIKAERNPEAVFELLQTQAAGRGEHERSLSIARPGQLVLQPGAERRRTSSHYTPKSLSAPIVARTLEPLLACMTGPGEAGPPSHRILNLKVCDPAMGSGAFLVEACRYLADRLLAAWTREGKRGEHYEHLHAIRRIAQRCLYGVDKNPTAVELAKLSLWLLTLAKDRPFTFLDNNLRHGDSLLGLSFDQIQAFHWQPHAQLETCRTALREAVQEATESRERIQALALGENGISPDPEEKEVLLRDADDALDRVRLIADACLGAFFAADKDKAREHERTRRLTLVERWLASENATDGARMEAELRELQAELRASQVPFHWMLEFPDVFWETRQDPLDSDNSAGQAFMDAFVGNPPFMGGGQVSSRFGDAYRDWLSHQHDRAHGNSDIVAHFFLRAGQNLGTHGTIGLIATNTIGQGDTRATGLQHLIHTGYRIYSAERNIQWPGDAAVTVSVIHLAKGKVAASLTPSLGGIPCAAVNSWLRGEPERADPVALAAQSESSFLGTKIYGEGFTLTPEEREALIARNRRNSERIFPYLGGEEVNTSPTQSHDRYVISFAQMSLEEAERWPDLLAIVREKVKPERDELKDNPDGRRLKHYWWQFGRTRPELYAAIAPLSRCLVTARVSKHLVISIQPTNRICSEQLYVFPLDKYAAFAVLQSRIHEPWARLLSSSMKTDLRYAASDCFETFPFPTTDPRRTTPELEAIGHELYTARARYMQDTAQGLTKTYNALKDSTCTDPRIRDLRALHVAMDCAVLETYGWSDLTVPPYCPAGYADRLALQRFEDQVIDRLFLLNAERAADEQREGVGQRPESKQADMQAPPKVKRPLKKTVPGPPTKRRRESA